MVTDAHTALATGNARHRTPQDHRFAELAARTGLEPGLERRYASDPVRVLSEFGLSAAESPYSDASDPVAILAEFGLSASEPLYLGGPLVIEDLEPTDTRSTGQQACLGCTRTAALPLPATGR